MNAQVILLFTGTRGVYYDLRTSLAVNKDSLESNVMNRPGQFHLAFVEFIPRCSLIDVPVLL